MTHWEEQSVNGCCYPVIRDYYTAACHDSLFIHIPHPTNNNNNNNSSSRGAGCSLGSGFRGGFYSTEQFKRKWLLFPALLCTSVRRWPCRRKRALWRARLSPLWLVVQCVISPLFLWFSSVRSGSHWGFHIHYICMHGPLPIHVVKDNILAISMVEFAGC